MISRFHLCLLGPLPKRLDRLDAQWCRLGSTNWQLTVPLLSVALGAYLTLMRHTHGLTILHQRLLAVKQLRVGFLSGLRCLPLLATALCFGLAKAR